MTMNLMIKNLRKSKGITQEQLADSIGVSLMTVRRWEWGNTAPNSNMLKKLAEVLNTTPENLLNDNTNENVILSTTENISALKDNDAAKKELVYEWGGGHRLALPNTPETREMFERLVMRSMTSQAAMA